MKKLVLVSLLISTTLPMTANAGGLLKPAEETKELISLAVVPPKGSLGSLNGNGGAALAALGAIALIGLALNANSSSGT